MGDPTNPMALVVVQSKIKEYVTKIRTLFSLVETQVKRIGYLFCKKRGLIILSSMKHIWGYRLILVGPEFLLSTILRAGFGAE
jgi:hypothetical protein